MPTVTSNNRPHNAAERYAVVLRTARAIIETAMPEGAHTAIYNVHEYSITVEAEAGIPIATIMKNDTGEMETVEPGFPREGHE